MKIQIALDTMTISQSLEIIDEIKDLINIVEVGTPMILKYGMEPVRKLKAKFPNLIILADTKIMDAGDYEASIAFDAGADIITVMGITNNETIIGAVNSAKLRGKNCFVMADLMCVPNIALRAKEIVDFGVDYVCVHTAVDVQETASPFASLEEINKTVDSNKTAIAGGIAPHNIHILKKFNPEIIITGNSITGSENKRKSVEELIKNYK